jgi:hypothetical protein
MYYLYIIPRVGGGEGDWSFFAMFDDRGGGGRLVPLEAGDGGGGGQTQDIP